MPRICIIGSKRGTVAALLAERLPGYQVEWVSARDALDSDSLHGVSAITTADVVVSCVLDFASPALIAKLPADVRVLDVSPAFRLHPDWCYGLSSMEPYRSRIALAHRVANPGCFATAALLLLKPLLEGCVVKASTPLYLDAVGGYSTGGAAMTERVESGGMSVLTAFSLNREHRHVAEIRGYSNMTGALVLCPKIGTHARGILMQVPLLDSSPKEVLGTYEEFYSASADIQVLNGVPKTMEASTWEGRAGAGIYVIPAGSGCVAICALDNLLKGAAQTAADNLQLMCSGL